jgi:hypothetical protein
MAKIGSIRQFYIASMGGSYIANLEIIDKRPFTKDDMTPLDKINGFADGMPKWKYLVEIDDEYEPGGKERKWLSSAYRWKR